MIYGIGIDLVEIKKFEKLFYKKTELWIKRGAHPIEIKLSPKKSANLAQKKRYLEYWSARFAVKEAFGKALGTGFGGSWNPKEVGVFKTKHGKPELKIEQGLRKKLNSLKIVKTHVSITHTDAYSVAMVVLETKR